jgi:glycerol-3-phosphate dehydrogenase subunit B
MTLGAARYDVVVVGAGVAGMTAAIRAAEGGARVLVLAKGAGATHLAPATVDVLGYSNGARVERPLEALESFAASNPGHPYSHVGAEEVRAALRWLSERVAGGSLPGYAYAGSGDENLLLATPAGALRPTAMAPESLGAGDLRAGGRVALVSFRQLRDFFPTLAAAELSAAASAGGPEVEARGIELDLPVEDRGDANALGLARRFDEPAFRHVVIAALVSRLQGDERVGFPAALGIADPHGAWSELRERLGREVFEVPTLPPSVPGLRLFKILRDALRRAGGRLVIGAEVTGVEASGDRVSAVRALVAAREQRHETGWLVLASGGFAAGGLILDSHWRAQEPVLGLHVAGVPEDGGRRFSPHYFDEHPVARAGIAVDSELRPLDASGERAYENVLVAGATLAGALPWREKSGDGISLATGHRAAGLILGGVMEATKA